MGDLMGAAQMLEVYARKCEEYIFNMENKHMVWLREIEEEARRMFSSDFNAEPELMPKIPSQKRRRKKGRQSGVVEEKVSTRQRLNRRSNNWCSSVRRLSMKLQDAEAVEPTLAVQDAPRAIRQTWAQAQKAVSAIPENSSMKTTENAMLSSMPQVRISNEDRQRANEILETVSTVKEVLPSMSDDSSHKEAQPPSAFLKASQTPDGTCRIASKVKIASSTPEKAVVEMNGKLIQMDISSVQDGCLKHEANDADAHVVQEADVLPMDLSAVITEEPTAETLNVSASKGTPTGSKSDRRSVHRSLVGRPSRCHSLIAKYSLASRRESMTREAMRKSIRRSISKKAWESSASSCHSSTDGVEDDTIKGRPEPTPSIAETEERESPQRLLRSRNARKIAISNEVNNAEQPSMQRAIHQMAKNGEDKENIMETGMEAQSARRKSYKRAVDSLSDASFEQDTDDAGQSPPRKKTPSPPYPSNKVVRPPAANMRSFLHTVQKNQLLMSTPGSSSSRLNIVKSFTKRTTPLKSDNKGDFVEKERQRLEALRRKQEAEIQRKQKMEEGKKRKLEELKLRREERQRKVLQARECVEQIGEEKKRKIEQKFAQIGEKSEKVKEDRLAEEKAKKKLTAKKMEEVEVRRRQDEEARRQKIQQMEEEERKHQEVMQKKRDEEEQEHCKKIAEAKKLAEQRQAELERERQREQQAAAEKDLERKRDLERVVAEKEKERHEKEKVLQQQREQEKAAREEAAAQERERIWREAEERKKEQQERQEKLRQELEQERREKEEERRAKEEQERRAREEKRAKEEQEKIAKENLTAASKALNATLEVTKSPASESYKMTPQSSKPKPPKICGDNYGMDLNSDDSTDDESEPRKPSPSWASGKLLNDILRQQFYNPINVDRTFGGIENPKLEEMFYKNKPRYIKRTSSAVWHSPPMNNYRSVSIPYSMKKF